MVGDWIHGVLIADSTLESSGIMDIATGENKMNHLPFKNEIDSKD